ncbi:hypothetical protein WJX77_006914 [Trebouxia sp. C0004]
MAKAEATETIDQGVSVAVAPADRHSQDKLQAELSMCLAAVHAEELLQAQEAAATKTEGSGKQQSTKQRTADVDTDTETHEDESGSDYAPDQRQRSVSSPAKRTRKGQKGRQQKRK